jgi:methylated-DNA-protein-cysteine methyltransferase related protein
VGWAMKAAPSKLPCHRVVNRLGEMAPGYIFGSKELQRDILESEGITFLENGCIDLKKYLWDSSQQ